MTEHRVLLVVPDPALRREVAAWLGGWGYTAVVTETVTGSRLSAGPEPVSALVVDVDALSAADGAGIELLEEARSRSVPVLLLTGRHAGPGAPPAGLGPHQPIPKPVDPARLRSALARVVDGAGSVPDHPALRLRAEAALWQSDAMQTVREVVHQAAEVDVTVLIAGETGTGKDLVARMIHHLSARHDRPFVKVNCAAVPRELLESELFGHERGAFTGAHQTRLGTFESANGGTVFLDEIGDLHPALQAKLLHVLQDGAFSRVGGRFTLKADVRVLAATNRDLERSVTEGHFRDDLYYRLNVIQITVPPLRERVEEIPLLIDYFVRRYVKLYNRDGFRPTAAAVERLMRHHYPGNVRELENIVKRMIVLADASLARIPLGTAPAPAPRPAASEPRSGGAAGISLKVIAKEAALDAERIAIAHVLQETGWNRTKAAKQLKISYRALLYKIKHAGLDRTSMPQPSR